MGELPAPASGAATGQRGALPAAAVDWRQLPARMLRRIPLMLLTVPLAWVLHTYWMVVKNEGFQGMGHWTAPFLNVNGNAAAAFLSFGLGSAVFWSVVFSLWTRGWQRTRETILAGPKRTLAAVTSHDGNVRLGVAAALALVLLPGSYLRVHSSHYMLWGGTFWLWSATFLRPLLQAAVQAGLTRVQGRFPWLRGFDVGKVSSGFTDGLPLAFLVGWLFTYFLAPKLGWIALLYVGYRVYQLHASMGGPAGPPPAALWWLAFAAVLWASSGSYAFADDGGWAEATGDGGFTRENVIRWWTSLGANVARGKGLLPALGAGLGVGLAPPLEEGDDPNRIIGYILQLNTDRFMLEAGKAANLAVAVWSVSADGSQALAGGAGIQLALSGDSDGEIVMQPVSGITQLDTSIGWSAGGKTTAATIVVTATAGGTTHTGEVQLSTSGGFDLVVTVHSEYV